MAVTVNTRGSGSAAGVASPRTFSSVVTIPNTTGIALVGVIIGNNASTVITSVTLGGTAVTVKTSRIQDNGNGLVWLGSVLQSATGSGAKDLVVTWTGGTSDVIAGVVCLDGQHASTPLGAAFVAAGNSAAAAVTVTDSVSGDIVIDVLGTGCGITSTAQTQEWLINMSCGTSSSNGAQSSAAGAAAVVMSYVVSSDLWAIIATAVKQAAAGAAATFSSRVAGGFVLELEQT